eukprot:7007557-Pyramimonas_sp.AAC.1
MFASPQQSLGAKSRLHQVIRLQDVTRDLRTLPLQRMAVYRRCITINSWDRTRQVTVAWLIVALEPTT